MRSLPMYSEYKQSILYVKTCLWWGVDRGAVVGLFAHIRRWVYRDEQARCGTPVHGSSLGRVVLSFEQTANHVHRDQGRALAHVGSTAGQPHRPGESATVRAFDAEPHQANRLLLTASARPGDAGQTDTHIGAQPAPRAEG